MSSPDNYPSTNRFGSETEVRLFLEKYPPGKKLNRILSNTYLLSKKISPEGKANLLVQLVQKQTIDILDIDAYLIDEDYIHLFSYCWKLFHNITEYEKNPPKRSRAIFLAFTKLFKMVTKKAVPTGELSLRELLELILSNTLTICCEKEDVNLLVEIYNVMFHSDNKFEKKFTKQILRTLLILPDEECEDLEKNTLLPMLESINYRDDCEIRMLYHNYRVRLHNKKFQK